MGRGGLTKNLSIQCDLKECQSGRNLTLCACNCISFIFKLLCAFLYNAYYLQYLFLENNIADNAQRKITVYTFQLNAFSGFSQKKIDGGRLSGT